LYYFSRFIIAVQTKTSDDIGHQLTDYNI